MESRKLILGSGSPRRRVLLGRLGIPFDVMVADVDEDVIVEPNPAKNVQLRAKIKGEALLALIGHGSYVLTADTTVAVDGEMLNKPCSDGEAWDMLMRLRGRTHQVYTGVVLTVAGRGVVRTWVCGTDVLMRPYTSGEIEAYIASGDPFDKAGGYAIQHPIFRPVERFDGCYSSVMGLPICEVGLMLAREGFFIENGALDGLKPEGSVVCLCDAM